MDQEKSKQVIGGIAFNHSEGVKNLLASMATGSAKPTNLMSTEKGIYERRISLNQVTWIMNRSVTL